MLKFLSLIIFCMVVVDSPSVIAESIEIFEGNNLIFNILTKDMVVKPEHSTSTHAFVERKPNFLKGCIAKTKPYKIGGKSRSLQIIPKLTLKWWGELGGPELSQLNLVKIVVEHLDGAKTLSTKSVYIHTDHLKKQWISSFESGSQYFHATLNLNYTNLKKHLVQDEGLMFTGVNIPEDHQFRLSVCDIGPSTRLIFYGFDVLARSEEG